MTRLLLFSALLATGVACMQPRDGTAVGNPGNLDTTTEDAAAALAPGAVDLAVVDAPDDVSLSRTEVAIEGLRLTACDGFSQYVEVNGLLDALGTEDGVTVPPGDYCELVFELRSDTPEGQLLIAGTTSLGVSFTTSLNPGTITLNEPFSVDGGYLLVGLSLQGLLSADEVNRLSSLGDTSGGTGLSAGDVDLPQSSFGAEGLSGVGVWLDADLDGAVGVDDPLVKDVLDDTGAPMAADVSEDAGCGCRNVGSGSLGGGMLLLLLLLTMRRRR